MDSSYREKKKNDLCSTFRNRSAVAVACAMTMVGVLTSAIYYNTHAVLSCHQQQDQFPIPLPPQGPASNYGNKDHGKQQEKVREQPKATGVSSSSRHLSPMQQYLHSLPEIVVDHNAPAAGGIILYHHVPKTGGTTIRDNFQNSTRFPNVRYKEAFTKKQWGLYLDAIDKRFDQAPNQRKTVFFVEIHGQNTPSLPEIAPKIRKWRQLAKDKKVPFYLFTLLRDPMDFAVSFFNHFHVRGDLRFESPLNATLENLQRTMQRNPQCLYLFKGEQAYIRRKRFYNVTPSDCAWIQTLLEELFDWVGDTQHLSYETLPLLTYWATGSTKEASALESSNVALERNTTIQFLPRRALDNITRLQIRQKMFLDQALYHGSLMSTLATKKLQ